MLASAPIRWIVACGLVALGGSLVMHVAPAAVLAVIFGCVGMGFCLGLLCGLWAREGE